MRSHSAQPAYLGSLTILTSLFFIWGFITCLNDILIPHLKAVFTLSYTQAMLIQFCFFAAYFVMSLPSGWLVERIGYQRGIVVGLAVAGSGCLLFYPAAGLRLYPLFLAALFVLASGITLLQVAANPYVTVLGPAETASSRLTMTQAFNSLGTTLAPFFGSLLILSATVLNPQQLQQLDTTGLAEYQAGEAAAVQQPYLLLAAVLFGLALAFAWLRLPEVQAEAALDESLVASRDISAWSYPHLVLGALAIFVYVGGEVSIGSFLVSFLIQPEVAGLSEVDAGRHVAFYWGGAMVGRFMGALAMRYVRPGMALACNGLCAVMLVLATIVVEGYWSMWTILAVGLFNSIMFPTIFSLALTGLGSHTGQGSGILCAAIVGGAILPVLQGAVADSLGIQLAFLVPLGCYAFIAYYGWHCRDLGENR